MEGDFTRNSDDPAAGYSGVLMQQGRVQLDSDWNEQRAIQTRALREALADLIGPYAGPAAKIGFEIKLSSNNSAVSVGGGIYYVDGIRVWERRTDASMNLPSGAGSPPPVYLAFLDVWERHVNAIEDPRIREVALLGPDTATRAELLWRVRFLQLTGPAPTDDKAADDAKTRIEVLRNRPRRKLAARANTANTSDDPCKLSPMSQFRGRENQLYRVEIHDAVTPASIGGRTRAAASDAVFTFKWSRDNASVVFPITLVSAPEPNTPAFPGDAQIAVTVTLGHLGRDERFGLQAGDMVEFVHDALTRGTSPQSDDAITEGGRDPGRHGLLGRVMAPIDRDAMTVRVAVFAPDLAEFPDSALHPYLRRWDQRDAPNRKLVAGAVPVLAADLGQWLALEDGVEVKFEQPSANTAVDQRAGDYWQIPARVATGSVLWPQDGSTPDPKPLLVPPHGPHHHYAPLAFVFLSPARTVSVRKQFSMILSSVP
jgi:Family of unknown function (DUF6519)